MLTGLRLQHQFSATKNRKKISFVQGTAIYQSPSGLPSHPHKTGLGLKPFRITMRLNSPRSTKESARPHSESWSSFVCCSQMWLQASPWFDDRKKPGVRFSLNPTHWLTVGLVGAQYLSISDLSELFLFNIFCPFDPAAPRYGPADLSIRALSAPVKTGMHVATKKCRFTTFFCVHMVGSQSNLVFQSLTFVCCILSQKDSTWSHHPNQMDQARSSASNWLKTLAAV